MARGRPHHQASRRRTYSRRQRDLRERHLRDNGVPMRVHLDREAIEVDDVTDAEGIAPWALAARVPAT